MRQPTSAQAAVLAATEVIPADWQDLAAILQRFGGPNALLSKSFTENDREAELLRYIQNAIDSERVEYWLKKLTELYATMPDVDFVTIDDTGYPQNLKHAYGSPPFLFVRGNVDERDRLALAIVGARRASHDGLQIASDVAAAAARHGITVISGLARGIDASAHRGSISAGGRTVAAIASGIDHALTRESEVPLGRMVPEFVSIVSQFRPGSPPTTSSFLQRNGVISGLSLVSLAIEAGERSGTSNEIEHSLRQRRKVLFWKSDSDNQSWIRLYAEHPLVKVVSTEEEVISEVLAAGRSLENDEL